MVVVSFIMRTNTQPQYYTNFQEIKDSLALYSPSAKQTRKMKNRLPVRTVSYNQITPMSSGQNQ
jgi:hypothetical protein